MVKEDYRVFEYSRKDRETGKVTYFAQIVVKGYDIICYNESILPPGIAEETAMKFFEEAEKAVLKLVDEAWESGTGV